MSALNDSEKAMLQQLADTVVAQIMPELVTDLESKVPAFLQGLVAMVVNPIIPGIEAKMQAYIDAKIAGL